MTAPRRPRSHDNGNTRDHILAVSLDAFAELGFDGASTRTIAARAGVNQGLIPYYFGTKEALWREAVDRAFAQLRSSVGDVVLAEESVNDRERLALLIRSYVRFAARHPEFVRLMNEEGKRDGPRMRWLVEHHVRPLFDSMTELFRRAGVSTRLGNGLEVPHFHYIFVGAVGTIFHQAPECRLLSGRDPSDEAVIEAHAEALVNLFLKENPA